MGCMFDAISEMGRTCVRMQCTCMGQLDAHAWGACSTPSRRWGAPVYACNAHAWASWMHMHGVHVRRHLGDGAHLCTHAMHMHGPAGCTCMGCMFDAISEMGRTCVRMQCTCMGQ